MDPSGSLDESDLPRSLTEALRLKATKLGDETLELARTMALSATSGFNGGVLDIGRSSGYGSVDVDFERAGRWRGTRDAGPFYALSHRAGLRL